MNRRILKLLSLVPLSLLLFLSGCEGFTVLDPKGPAASQQKSLILWSIILMLFIVLVVFVVFTVFLVRYRERPAHKNYDPEQTGNKTLEVIWTLVPVVILVALAIPTVHTIFSLESAPKASAHKQPLVIKVTSADWKFIFSYPKQGIETVNYVNIPKDVPVKFKLTSADSMASIWIPELGGEKYTMAGMQTQQILQADETGTFQGRNGNYNGKEFAKMTFKVHSQTKKDFNQWADKVKTSYPKLTEDHYINIIQPGVVGKKSFSSTHLQYVDHAKNAEYILEHNKTRDLKK